MENIKARLSARYGYIEKDIDIIYDIEKAKQHKKEMDNAIIKFKERKKKREIKETITIICALIIAVIMIITKMTHLLLILGIISILPIIMYYFSSRLNEYVCEPRDNYTTDIEYYLETENKQILSIKIIPEFEYLNVEIVTENKDHSTNKKNLNFKIIEKTNLNHIILNVNEEVVYVPYER